MMYTSYFGVVTKLPILLTPIAICGKKPAFFKGEHFPKLAPTYDIFQQWRETGDSETFARRFKDEVLAKLDWYTTLKEFCALIPPHTIPCLVCYEAPKSFCHRHIVAEWLNENGMPCREWSPDIIVTYP